MAAVSKAYGVGDTVFVAYPIHQTELSQTPQSRVVKDVLILTGTNEATVMFTNGQSVLDGAVQTVFTTNLLAATAIVDDVIAKFDAVVNIDPTTSLGSTVSQPTLSLGRVDA